MERVEATTTITRLKDKYKLKLNTHNTVIGIHTRYRQCRLRLVSIKVRKGFSEREKPKMSQTDIGLQKIQMYVREMQFSTDYSSQNSNSFLKEKN